MKLEIDSTGREDGTMAITMHIPIGPDQYIRCQLVQQRRDASLVDLQIAAIRHMQSTLKDIERTLRTP